MTMAAPPNSMDDLRLRVTTRLAALLESQNRTKGFTQNLNALLHQVLSGALDELDGIVADGGMGHARERIVYLRGTCQRFVDTFELLVDERERQWHRNGDYVRGITLEFNDTIGKLASTLVEKDLLERQSRVLERIILSHENVSQWQEFVQEILLDFHGIFPFDFFYIAFADEHGLSLYIYYVGAFTDDARHDARQFLSRKMLASLGLRDDVRLTIEEFTVLAQGRSSGLSDARMITVAVPEHTPRLAGLLGVAYVSDGALTAQEESVVRSILSVMVMVVGSSKLLSRTLTELEYYAAHDPLTGLHNRRYFNEVLSYEIGRSGRHHHEFALILLDLDNFKDVNDTYGHQTGDQALSTIADLLRERTRKGDLAARVGGDEFMVLLTETGRLGAAAFASKLGSSLREQTFRAADGKVFHMTGSIGISIFPTDAETETDLIAGADVAMYKVKELGKDSAVTFDTLSQHIEFNRSTREHAEQLREALQENRVRPFFQRIVDCSSGELFACEALARIIDRTGGIITAGSFIGTIEKYGMARDLDRAVIEQALQAKQQQMRSGRPGMKVFLNLSAQEIQGRNILAYAEQLCNELQIPPGCIVFELLERDAIGDMTNMRMFLSQLRDKGFEFALDDFGSGYNSFHYLRELRFEYVKIDGTFVRNILNSKVDFALVRNLSNLCQDLGIRTVAEYVESQDLLEAIRDMGINFAQGFHLGVPERLMP